MPVCLVDDGPPAIGFQGLAVGRRRRGDGTPPAKCRDFIYDLQSGEMEMGLRNMTFGKMGKREKPQREWRVWTKVSPVLASQPSSLVRTTNLGPAPIH